MKKLVSFRCPACNAKLKAAVKLVGQSRPCPACREQVSFLPVAPEPAGPALVIEDLHLPAQAFANQRAFSL